MRILRHATYGGDYYEKSKTLCQYGKFYEN